MAERRKIALRCIIDRTWMGGVYYILNIIRSFNALPDDEQPEVILLCRNEEDYRLAREYSGYPHMEVRYVYKPSNTPLPIRAVNKIWRTIFNHSLIASPKFKENVEGIYPQFEYNELCAKSPRYLWIPDMQHKELPEFSSAKRIKQIDRNINHAIARGMHIVFSSNDARDTFHRYFNCKRELTHVFHFTAAIPEIPNNSESILKNYGVIPDSYLLCSNQFWAHKNHTVLFQAINQLKHNGRKVTLLCTGNSQDSRNKDYYSSLLDFINDNNLHDNVRLLGQIPKEHLNALIANCYALVQPSLFEGWNTSVEEAKALNKFTILSDLTVHIEQATNNVAFFHRHDPKDLADTIDRILDSRPTIVDNKYQDKIIDSARSLLNILTRN